MALTVLLGGARSGKSSIAVAAAQALGEPVVYIATAEALDEDMAGRIARHQDERPAEWKTIEEPLEVAATLHAVDPTAVVVVDCLTLWVTNALAAHGVAWTLEHATAAAAVAKARVGDTLVVSNEVGSGIVPADGATREWRDVLGQVNATFARAADRAFLCVAGRVLSLDDAAAVIRE